MGNLLHGTLEVHNVLAAGAVASDPTGWTIYKYPAPIQDEFTLDLPEGAQVLSVAEQYSSQVGQVFLWAFVQPKAKTEKRRFRWIGTGHPVSKQSHTQLIFIGTLLLEEGSLVFHLFEVY